MSGATRIPATFISSGRGTLTICCRHGEPAAEQKRTRFASTTPNWAYALVLAGVIPFFIAAAAVRKRVDAPAWPFCPRCGTDRIRRLTTGIGLLGTGIIAGVLSGTVLPHDQQGIGVVLALTAILAGLGISGRAGRAGVAGGVVVSGGREVEFAQMHEAFARQVTQAQHDAVDHDAVQQAAQPL
jgi:hypothetical protein